MSKNEAIRFLDDYKSDRELMEKVEAVFEANTELEEHELWLKAAEENGYAFSPEELDEAFRERVNDAGKVSISSDAELAAVAGGNNCHDAFWCDQVNNYTEDMKHSNCSDSFVDRENCWHNDGCDNCYNMYSDYECKNSGECSNVFTHR